MNTPILDLSFLYQLSDNDPVYIHDVIKLFLDSAGDGLAKLERTIRETDDFETIRKQAHFLKSSSSVVKVREMYDDLCAIEALAREGSGKPEIEARLENILINYKEAMPLILAEQERTRQ
jgi:HPt (histidine-containing phosphotransfer) domain-containing protein